MSNSNKPKPILNAFSSFGRTILSLFTFGSMNRTSRSVLEEEAITSPGKTIVKNFMRNKLALIGLTGLILMTTFVFGGSYLIPFDVLSGEWAHKNLPPSNNMLKFPAELEANGIDQIVSGRSFSIGLDKTGKVHTWGIDVSEILTVPEEVKAATIVKIAAGDEHVLALSSTGKLFAWGNNSFEQGSVPMSISNILMIENVVDMGGGDIFSYIITDKGRLYVWGGTLSNGLDIVPTRLQGNLVSAGASTVSMLLLKNDQSIDYHGARGTQISEIPTYLLNGSVKIQKVEASIYTGLALDTNGYIHQWGFSGNGMRDIPEKVSFNDPNRISFVDIQAGRRHFVALGSDGNVYAWGDNEFGQLNVPASLKQGKVVAIHSDFFQNYAVLEDGSLVSWGIKGFILGSDENGKDIFIRLIHGGRITMTVGAVAVLISTFLGVLIGLIAGFYGKWVDNFLMRFAEIVSSFPFLPLAITLSAFLTGQLGENQRILMIMVILGIISWPGLARLVRGQILAEREKEFVLAARALGIRSKIVIIRHILPNVINLIIVSMTLSYAGSLLTEAGLSFLGFGVKPPSPSWGNMLTGAQRPEVIQFYWWRWVLPALAVLFTALSVNLVGDGLREAMDPRANEK
jgi:peptide/nickel transport system permease protein